ncbi:MAG: DUF72 domain-containing protein [Ectobacillus sp.]
MILVGLTGWGDHDSLYPDKQAKKNKLLTYSRHFPIVEIDSSFYAIQPIRNYNKWIAETPDHFSFVVKAYQGMTGHMRGNLPFESPEEMFAAFQASIAPLLEAGKLKAILFQYPPWFDCQKKHVDMLRFTKEKMREVPCAVEFRNQTWFLPEFREKTLAFLEKEKWIHTICDEPQAGIGSVPIVAHPTHPDLTLIRFHGRNVHGWVNNGHENWRAVRCLYRYNEQELTEWVSWVKKMLTKTREICLLFNNNSGGDAADNAKQMMRLLNMQHSEPEPEQLDLF